LQEVNLSILYANSVYVSSRFEVFKAMKIQTVVFWIVTPCAYVLGCHVSEHHSVSIFRVKTDNTFLWSVDIIPHHYTATQSRRPRSIFMSSFYLPRMTGRRSWCMFLILRGS